VRRDLYTSLALIALGIGVLAESMRMPRFEHLGVNPYTIPGIVPGVLGVVIALLGAVMLSRTIIGLRRRKRALTVPGGGEPGSATRLLLTLFLTVGYGGFLVGWLPFWLATLLFVAVFLLVFEWRPRLGGGKLLGYLTSSLLQAALVAVAVTFVFERIFLVTLP
jgi:hypothetical protein